MKITVIAHPNSKSPRIEEDLLKVVHVYVKEPPLEGRANQAVIEALARFYGIKPRNIVLLRGNKSKNKVFEIG